jgi:hypothetical protein
MPGMRTSRRLFALVAAFTVAFGALWPLVSTAGSGPQVPSFICTQGGTQGPAVPADHADKSHCALCVMTPNSIVPSFAPVGAWSALSLSVRMPVVVRPFTPRYLAQPPPSRAPPLHS